MEVIAVARRSPAPRIPRSLTPCRLASVAPTDLCSEARLVTRSTILAISFALLAGCGPPRTWDAHTTSSLMEAPLDPATLTGGRVATLGVVAPPALQG